MRHTGLLSVTFRDLPFERIIELAVKAGLEGIEWGGDVHVVPGDLEAAERIGKATRDAGLRVYSYGSYWRGDSEPTMIAETASALGAQWIRIWAGRLGSSECPPEMRREIAANLRGLCRCSNGLQVAAEWHPDTLTDTAASAARLLEDVGEGNFFCYFQRNSHISDNLGELASFPKGRIRAVHVQQYENGQRFPLAKGMVEWRKLLAMIPEEAPALLEFVKGNSEEQFFEDARVLRQLAGEGE
ncbi:MAG: sugar phosphate isomerase/epimerase [Victivallales bacterium]|nr:sugar phosphate isomerase/epimerase [Victivallales bacterium]